MKTSQIAKLGELAPRQQPAELFETSRLPGGSLRSRLTGLACVLPLALVALLASCANVPAENAEAVLQRANAAMGGTALKSIAFSGTGTGATFGQAYLPGQAWPKITAAFLAWQTTKTSHLERMRRGQELSPTAAVRFP